jgi:hypothetical protein
MLYLPKGTGTVVLANTASTSVVVPPEARVTWLLARTRNGPGGETLAVRVMVPEKPLMLVMLRKSLFCEPWGMVRELGFADIVKSAVEETVTVKDPNTWWNRGLLVPVTV